MIESHRGRQATRGGVDKQIDLIGDRKRLQIKSSQTIPSKALTITMCEEKAFNSQALLKGHTPLVCQNISPSSSKMIGPGKKNWGLRRIIMSARMYVNKRLDEG